MLPCPICACDEASEEGVITSGAVTQSFTQNIFINLPQPRVDMPKTHVASAPGTSSKITEDSFTMLKRDPNYLEIRFVGLSNDAFLIDGASVERQVVHKDANRAKEGFGWFPLVITW